MTRLWTAVALSASLAVPVNAQEASAVDELSLTQAIALALAREPATRAARADIETARGLRLHAGLRSNPTMSFERRQEPGGTDSATTAAIEWPLDLFRRGARVAAAEADVTVAEYQEADIRRQLAGDVAMAYGDVAVAVRTLAITDDVLAAASQQLELLRARAEQGSTPTLDRDMVDVDVRRIQADRLVQAGRVDSALLRLKRLLGLSAASPLRVTQTLEELTTTGAVVPTGTEPSRNRPDVQAAEARVRAAEERIAAARQEARPDISLFGSYMRMDAGFPQRAFDAHGGLERVRGQFNYVTAGAMVTVPLWNRQQGTLAAATATRAAAEARADATRLTASLEATEARLRYDTARRAVALYQDGIRPLARRNFDTVRETYQLGRATVFDILTEQRRYLETERAHTDALSEAYAARVSLGRATGDLR